MTKSFTKVGWFILHSLINEMAYIAAHIDEWSLVAAKELSELSDFTLRKVVDDYESERRV